MDWRFDRVTHYPLLLINQGLDTQGGEKETGMAVENSLPLQT